MVYRRQARAMFAFFLAMGALSLVAAMLILARQIWPN